MLALWVFPGVNPFVTGLLAGNLILLMLPDSSEDVTTSLVSSILTALCAVLLRCLVSPDVTPSGLVLCFVSYSAWRTASRFRKPRKLFEQASLWASVESCWRALTAFAVLCCAVAFYSVERRPGVSYAVLSVLATAYVMQYLGSVTGRLLFLGRGAEKLIKGMIKGTPRPSAPVDPDEQGRMNTLYARVLGYMESKKPYLDERFKISDMARGLYTNKVYLSRTINACSGRNFCQFVNSYRIDYAEDLMNKDPHLRVFEVAMMSGFHSLVSFNMAFKLFHDESPLAYMTRVRDGLG